MPTKYEDGWYLVWPGTESADSTKAEIHKVINDIDLARGQKVDILRINGWSYVQVVVVTEMHITEMLSKAYQAGVASTLELLQVTMRFAETQEKVNDEAI